MHPVECAGASSLHGMARRASASGVCRRTSAEATQFRDVRDRSRGRSGSRGRSSGRGSAVLVGQRRDLARSCIRDGLRRRHDAAGVVEVGAVAVGRRVRRPARPSAAASAGRRGVVSVGKSSLLQPSSRWPKTFQTSRLRQAVVGAGARRRVVGSRSCRRRGRGCRPASSRPSACGRRRSCARGSA